MTQEQAAQVLQALDGLRASVEGARQLLGGVLAIVTALACVVSAACGYLVGRRQG